jgi:hypothetical protein
MADAVTSQTLQDGDKSVVMKFTNISDGSGEAAVKKVDVSALQSQSGTDATCTGVSIQQVWYELNGMTVDLIWDASTDVLCWTLSGYGFFDFRSAGPLTNNSGGGKTGDLMFTTTGHASGDRYSVMIKMGKSYE